MAVYAVGDIHGRLQTLRLLLEIAGVAEGDTLWLTGDLVSRGPDSLGVLRWAFQNRRRIVAVLGNHDLHLLAARAGAATPGEAARTILAAEDGEMLCDFLQALPLLHSEGDYVLLHAGRMPEWEQRQAEELAHEAALRIRGGDFFSAMYGDCPHRWHPALSPDSRHRLIVNALTRMRLLTKDGGIFLPYAGAPQHRPPLTLPWFDAPRRRHWAATTVCGHWSSLGLMLRRDVMAIDTGGFGGALTAMRLDDRKIFQAPLHPDDSVRGAQEK